MADIIRARYREHYDVCFLDLEKAFLRLHIASPKRPVNESSIDSFANLVDGLIVLNYYDDLILMASLCGSNFPAEKCDDLRTVPAACRHLGLLWKITDDRLMVRLGGDYLRHWFGSSPGGSRRSAWDKQWTLNQQQTQAYQYALSTIDAACLVADDESLWPELNDPSRVLLEACAGSFQLRDREKRWHINHAYGLLTFPYKTSSSHRCLRSLWIDEETLTQETGSSPEVSLFSSTRLPPVCGPVCVSGLI
ncbi:hypothetical protein Pmar_PMAR006673 [Perkinsus marinus ATCC 50983]|uniref:Uncharacterized protein n=1 Tax=Perkinsus marinus (strain ATCC 50983 / TXsc) TaxID=423536 RepID=C5LLX9_PERM5|nr:hypothetical protein Pmar_PMAR006673 [Perkinsus marinus ATCC 50983]EER02351.1 hypothetical protein Pmar_PMAR006673 [Perkinsus marinus ATCC 50983]|eukprot:XP_002769633.1 hypothetical protein Pmar_PMAR006673 [Perkinsus marinus ATCC 50983]